MKKFWLPLILTVFCFTGCVGGLSSTESSSSSSAESSSSTSAENSTSTSAESGDSIFLETPKDTNLEFWITQEVTLADFEGHQEKYGWFGANEFYGKGYEPTMDENNEQIDPEYCVKYLVTNYPDYASPTLAVTQISITDPSVTFYGLSLTSSDEEIKSTMQELGYEVSESGYEICAEKGNVTFRFSESSIFIVAKVTNHTGIIF